MVFSVSYDTPTEKVKEILNRIANAHPAVFKKKNLLILEWAFKMLVHLILYLEYG